MEGILAISFIFGGGTLFLVSISPIGKAIAARIQGRAPGESSLAERQEEFEQWMIQEIDRMRGQIGEIEERVEFTERMLTQQKESPALSGPVDEASP